jgi:NADH:ubiquinone oxidoreductase subunit F (NADH-binding)
VINKDQIDVMLDIDHVSDSGGRLGCGTILVIDDSNCIVDIVRNNLDFFRDESCGKCTPCREGGTRLYELIDKLCQEKGNVKDLETIEDLAETMRLTALCGLGHSTAVPVLSSIQNFYEDYIKHIDKEGCPVCSQMGGK